MTSLEQLHIWSLEEESRLKNNAGRSPVDYALYLGAHKYIGERMVELRLKLHSMPEWGKEEYQISPLSQLQQSHYNDACQCIACQQHRGFQMLQGGGNGQVGLFGNLWPF